MAVELQELYEAVKSSYDIQLRTKSCYGKQIEWVHMVEGVEFVKLLHGDELALNSGLNYHSEEWLYELIKSLYEKGIGGLILTLRENTDITQGMIDYCDSLAFPLFTTAWETPYVEIIRIFSVILLKKNEMETTLAAALKNVIYYPDNEKMYQNHLERHGFLANMVYHVAIIGCVTLDDEVWNTKRKEIQMQLKMQFKQCIAYEAEEKLVILFAGYQKAEILSYLEQVCEKTGTISVGLGITVTHMSQICISFEKAMTAYRMTQTSIEKRCLDYEGLGVYKIISEVKEKAVCDAFVEEVLGKLIAYDKENKVPLLPVLEAYFEYECSIMQTAEALYFHVNTMKYKLNKIKEILGYDILSNENRMKIMLAFYIMRIRDRKI